MRDQDAASDWPEGGLPHGEHPHDYGYGTTHWAALCEKFPCPECGGNPTSIEMKAVEEFRFAPRDSDGRPMLYAPYNSEQGTTGGILYRTTVTCENGHVAEHEDITWFDEPHKGPPIL